MAQIGSARSSSRWYVLARRRTWLTMRQMPRIQSIYSTYCSRHHRAILLLQDLEPTIRPYLAECKNLSHGRTNAWDLASLLIKPVQRCLKYPLLLQQILEATPKDHPSRASLRLANTQMLGVAEHINEVKKRLDIVGKIVTSKSKGKGDAVRRASTASVSSIGSVSFGRAVTKKFMRSTTKVKHAVGVVAHPTDDIFDLLTAQVDSTRSAIVAFSTEMRDFSSKAGQALEAQMRMVEGWRDVYAPLDGELSPECVASHDRLTVFLDEVLQPVLAGPWREMDDEIRHELSLKTEHLLSLFENPRSVIAKRNDKDHARFLAKRDPEPIDRRRSEEFALLTSQLREELPVFLNSCARYFNIIIGHFATAQARYYAAVQVAWCDFARRYGIQMSTLEGIEPSYKAQHNPMERLMENLAQYVYPPPSNSSDALQDARYQKRGGGLAGHAAAVHCLGHVALDEHEHSIWPEDPLVCDGRSDGGVPRGGGLDGRRRLRVGVWSEGGQQRVWLESDGESVHRLERVIVEGGSCLVATSTHEQSNARRPFRSTMTTLFPNLPALLKRQYAAALASRAIVFRESDAEDIEAGGIEVHLVPRLAACSCRRPCSSSCACSKPKGASRNWRTETRRPPRIRSRSRSPPSCLCWRRP